MESKKTNAKFTLAVAIALIIQSFSSVFIKLAGRQEMLSIKFVFFYGIAIVCLGIFAIMWQMILEKIPLSTAYLRKGITYVLILIWSALFFKEQITWQNVAGSILIIIGVGINANDV